MKLYDEIIKEWQDLFQSYKGLELKRPSGSWPEVSDRSMILRNDMAYELGPGLLPGIGCSLITANQELVKEDAVFMLGRDLPDISKDSPYARISLVRVDESTLGEQDALYNAIRKLEYTKYHFYPEGFMMRVSSTKQKEGVRIGKAALEKGLDFSKTGWMMVDAFHKNKIVQAVHNYYVTLEEFDYKKLETLSRASEDITKTIDHILKNVMTDCSVCNLQEICNEVEGLRELHFSGKNN